MFKTQKRLGQILIEKKVITQAQLEMALAEQSQTKEFLGAIIVKHKWFTEKDLLVTLSEQFHIPLVELKGRYIDWKVVKGFTSSLILDNHCIPLHKDADGSVTVAITNPLDAWSLKKVEEEAAGVKLKYVLTSEADMQDAIERYRAYVKSSITKFFD